MSTRASDHLDVERALLILRRRWWVIALFTVLVAAASFAFSKHQAKQYTATASVLFQNPQLSQEESGLQATPSSPTEDPTVMATNIQLLTQQTGVAEATARVVGHGLTPSGVSQAIGVSQQGQTSVANVSATSTDPGIAAAIANTYAAQFIAAQQAQQRASVQQALNLVERQLAALSNEQIAGTSGQALQDRAESLRILANLQDGGAQVVDSAKVPTSPSSPKPLRNTAVGLILGLLLGLSAAFLLEHLDRRMKTVEDLEQTYGLPLLAAVPHDKSYTLPPLASGQNHRGQREVFRLLRAYLRYFNVDREIRSLLVVSAAPGDGKTTVARNLAQAAQETGTQTLLIDADFRRPEVARFFSIRAAPGLSDVLIGSDEPEHAVQSIPIAAGVNGNTTEAALDVLVAGHPPPNPTELIESHAMANVLSWATERYDLVVIDTAPLSVVSDAIPLLRRVDGVVLVSQLGKNTRDAAALLRDRLASLNAPLLGVVANGADAKVSNGYGYGYGYGYYGAEVSTASQAGVPTGG